MTVTACSSGTLTNVLPHRSVMPQTQDMTPNPVTVYSCECTQCVGLFAFVPPQGCEAILIKILQPKRYCLLVKSPPRLQHSGCENLR